MRVHAWQENLVRVLEAATEKSFKWGEHDCCQFAAQCIEAVTGENKLSLYSTYASKPEAEAILASLGGMHALISKALGEAIHPSRAGMGDIVLVDMGLGLQPATCMGINSFAPGARGLEYRPTLTATAAWAV